MITFTTVQLRMHEQIIHVVWLKYTDRTTYVHVEFDSNEAI